jgi:DNA-binding GntR family transcriptional regulator
VIWFMGVKRDCMRGQICRELYRRIVGGTYRPGERLVELKIAREFNTSQAPVREALRELEALRLVESETYRGTRVREITEREMHEASLVRGVLEQLAAVEAALTLRGNTAGLAGSLDGIEQAAKVRDLEAYARHNLAFHRQIVEAAGNAVMLRVWDSLMLETLTLIGLNARPRDIDQLAAVHRPILEALHRGEGAEAGRLLREHAESVCPNSPNLPRPLDTMDVPQVNADHAARPPA